MEKDETITSGDDKNFQVVAFELERLLECARRGEWERVTGGLRFLGEKYWSRMSAAAEQRFECVFWHTVLEYLGIPEKFS